ncbi:MAG: glycosyltransferase family 2 protein [Candidatus Hydrogenedentes bacterium]|nr:glycosyltransferase family 2 protein [Candidatus Hydrogenedentota bacterium]
MDADSGKVSIVTATYNRSRVLAYAVRSVLHQSHGMWEHLIIGDACTDDTATVVSAFADSRITFVNLARRCGEQSGPNNEGVARATGDYVAFLNHDDLWFPDHLETCVGALREDEADIVFTLYLSIRPDGQHVLGGVCPTRAYRPHVFVPASTWLMRRATALDVGPWRMSSKCFNVPSQEWLFRAWKQGLRVRLVPHLTVLAVQAGRRPQAYRNQDASEHEVLWQRMTEEHEARVHMLAEASLGLVAALQEAPIWKHWLRPFRILGWRAAEACGVHPASVRNGLLYGGRGGFVRHLHRRRGSE